MNTLLPPLRALSRRAIRAFERAAPFLLAADPTRPPPPALWLDLWRRDSRDPRPVGPAPTAARPTPAVCCRQCA